MKNAALIIFFVFTTVSTFAQNTWIGNTPGHETDWMEARNWSRQRVPAPNDNVLIPHLWHNNYPEVRTDVPAIAHLEVEGGARITITSGGYLPIDGSSTYNSGVLLVGQIINNGTLAIIDTAREAIDGDSGHLSIGKNGQFTSNGQLMMAYEYHMGR